MSMRGQQLRAVQVTITLKTDCDWTVEKECRIPILFSHNN